MVTFNISSFEELKNFSKVVFEKKVKVFLLNGDLGAGKTTFVSTFIKENLTSDEESFLSLGVMSPTFSLINQYKTPSSSIVHADMYRLKGNDFEKEDLLELIEDSDYTFIEWSANLKNLSGFLEGFKVASLEFKLDKKTNERTAVFKTL